VCEVLAGDGYRRSSLLMDLIQRQTPFTADESFAQNVFLTGFLLLNYRRFALVLEPERSALSNQL